MVCVSTEEMMWEKGILQMRVFSARGEDDSQKRVANTEGPVGFLPHENAPYSRARANGWPKFIGSPESRASLMTIPNPPFLNRLRKDLGLYGRWQRACSCQGSALHSPSSMRLGPRFMGHRYWKV